MLRAQTLVAAGALAFATVGLAAAPATAQVMGRFDRTLKVSGPLTLSISSGSGSVTVTPGADGSVHVLGTIRGNNWRRLTGDSVERAVRAVEANPPIVQNGSIVSLGETDRDDDEIRRVSISWEVTAPRGTSLTVKTGSGSHEIGAFVGPVTATSGSGSISIGATGGTVDVRTGSGSIDVDGARDRVNASSGSGSIELGTVSGKVSIDTGSGSISVRDAPDATVDVTTGSGSIDVSGLVGGLTARAGSGSIHVNGKPTSDWNLHTSSGEIVLGIPDGSSFRVQASTSSGSINSDHKLTLTRLGRRELTGEVGSGGVLVAARTSSGSIRIRH
jgi:DUF4097 and DUF4098 domain-containing protein YvlB